MADALAPPISTTPPSDARQRTLVLFDGDCALCNASVRWIIRRDPGANLRFAPLTSPLAHRLLADVPRPLPDSMAVVEWLRSGMPRTPPPVDSHPGPLAIVYFRSSATLAILRHLRFPWNLLRVFSVIPRSVRDAAYDCIARRRRRFSRARASAAGAPALPELPGCPIPDPALRARLVTTTDELDA